MKCAFLCVLFFKNDQLLFKKKTEKETHQPFVEIDIYLNKIFPDS